MLRCRFRILLIVCLLSWSSLAFGYDELPGIVAGSAVDLLLERAMSSRLIAGGVVLVGNRDGILYTASRGRLAAIPGMPKIDEHTIFDVASLTKALATAPAVMKLLEEGRVSLTDPLSRWFPEFRGLVRGDITIQNLLTHTSGLDDSPLPATHPLKAAIRKAVRQRSWQRPGSHFSYADINFILLGELVKRVSGSRLDAFCRDQLYGPLDLHETMFLPPRALSGRIAPTIETTGGIVQDRNARRLGGVAGHAGLFSSATDLARMARMILKGGEIDGVRVFSEQTVALMTSPQVIGSGTVIRALGWDIDSPFAAPKGNFSALSFGHTGYSGSSIWIDPQRDLFVILLTIRLEYQDTKLFNQLRRDVSTLAGGDFRISDYIAGLRIEPPVLLTGRPAVRPLRIKNTSRYVQHRPVKTKIRTAKKTYGKNAIRNAKNGIGRAVKNRIGRAAKTGISRAAKTGIGRATSAQEG